MQKRITRYRYNPDTLLYEEKLEPKGFKYLEAGTQVIATIGLVCLYFWLYTSVFGWDLPKTAVLKKTHAEWESRMVLLNRQLDLYDQTLTGIEDRDDHVYRSIFGLSEVPDEIKKAGFGGINRYEYLDRFGANYDLKSTIRRMDILTKRTYVQSQALDEVAQYSVGAGDMLACVPSVPPLLPEPGTFHLSSPFGGRRDPVYGGHENHTGQDFASERGNPVYATGDGIVEKAKSQFGGYGNEIVINHGYGYRTRYAHLSVMLVREGVKVHRGDKIGAVGNTGKSTGPHLHYEVEYRGNRVNPMKYMDINMPVDEYKAMIERRGDLAKDKKASTTELLRRRRMSDE